MKFDLKTYKKNQKSKVRDVITTVSISQENKDFIESQDLNLSKLVRDLLDSLQRQTSNK